MDSEVDRGSLVGSSETRQETGLAQKVCLSHGMDRLSRLPVELLDSIFELASSSVGPTLTIDPISKALLPSQERAIYETIAVDSNQDFHLLVRTLDAQPRKGRHTKHLVLPVPEYWQKETFDRRWLLRHLPNVDEIEVYQHDETISVRFDDGPDLLPFIPSLRTCRFQNIKLDSALVTWLSRIPTLRLVEVSRIVSDKEEEEDNSRDWTPARQVLQVSIQSVYPIPASSGPKLLRFFPSAFISSLDISVSHEDPIRPLFDNLDTRLLSLRLRGISFRMGDKTIDSFLPKFSRLQHLHLDPSFTSGAFQTHLLALLNLVSLSLAYDAQEPNLDELYRGLDRLPHLRTLKFTYLGIEQGKQFDLAEAEEESFDSARVAEIFYRNDFFFPDSSLQLLAWDIELSSLSGWSLPWADNISDVLPRVIEMEEKAKAAGLIVESNFPELWSGFRLQVAELYNRAVGAFYLNGDEWPLRDALSLARKHGLDIDRLEFDLDDGSIVSCRHLRWFKVRIGEVGRSHLVYGLRYKTWLKLGESGQEKEDDEKAGSDQGSEESEVD
ncbi:uncharacterized protein JCM6883_004317 [Sporobolomyces salmoneus]|uniref:uncharacterized protein n=1 Tax=Sporobolomyces salmoneus TaxID=183962 RepID=UPI00317D5C64